MSKAFIKFKEQETKHGEKYFVKPSGSLESQLAHYLNQPSFSTNEDRLENGETADEHSPCTRTLMDNAFQPRHTMMLDHFHRRSNDCDDVEDENSSVLKRHESFTFDILASSEAKVIYHLVRGKGAEAAAQGPQICFLLALGSFQRHLGRSGSRRQLQRARQPIQISPGFLFRETSKSFDVPGKGQRCLEATRSYN